MIPKENWSTTIVNLAALEGVQPKRIRLVWNAEHTMGWIGLVETQKAEISALPCAAAIHSDGRSVITEIAERDKRAVTLLPGQHIDLEFDASSLPAGSHLVFLSHGRYFHPGAVAPVAVPRVFYLGKNRPNPFNPETEIEFGLPRESTVRARVFDVSGRLVKDLINATFPAGVQVLHWNGRDDRGRQVGSGVYYLDLRADSFSARRRMVLLR
jgi:hypothetical protein